MAYNAAIDHFCEDPSNPYQVTAELKIRKMLEKHTNWKLEFVRNDDQYGVDIECYKYTVSGDSFNKEMIGKVEVEVSKQWEDGVYPPKWRTYSYLRRKIEGWTQDGATCHWHGEVKSEGEKVVYLKAAIDMSDCHAALVSDIWKHGRKVRDKNPSLTDDRAWYFRTPLRSCPITKRGWEESIKFIIKTFESNQTENGRKYTN